MPNQRDDTHRHKNQSGFALAVVLWAIIILSLMAVIIAGLSRSSSSIVDIHIRQAQADALLDAGINQLTLALLDPRSPWKADGKEHRMELHEETLLLSARYERGKIDLNHASEELIAALLNMAGASPRQAGNLAAAIVKQRPTARASVDLTNTDDSAQKRFNAVSELQRIPGMSSSLYCRVSLFFTVYSQQSEVDIDEAFGLTLNALAAIGIKQHATPPAGEGAIGGGSDLGGQAIMLRVELTSSGSLRKGLPSRVKEVVVRLTGDMRQPVWYLSMHEDMNQGVDCATTP